MKFIVINNLFERRYFTWIDVSYVTIFILNRKLFAFINFTLSQLKYQKMKALLVVLFAGNVCCAALNSQAQTKSESDVKEAVGYINSFFKIYNTEGSDKALDYISTKNSLTIISRDKWNYLKSKLDSINSTLGNFTGFELINEKKIAGSLVLFSYLVKHKNYPIRFIFVFYKPENHWLIDDVMFDSDDMIEELKQSSKTNSVK